MEASIMASKSSYKLDGIDENCGCTFFPKPSWSLDTKMGERRRRKSGQQQEYTDADFAKDMQGLSFQEIQKVNEDVHLVADQVRETAEFVEAKIKEVIEVLKNQPKSNGDRDAWDRAVFLRPSLATDNDHYLIFLRAKSYDAFDAAMLIQKFYESKRLVWGNNLLVRRISWDDLTDVTKAYYRRAYIQYLPRNKENPCRRVWYYRASIIEAGIDPMECLRAIMYPPYSNNIGNTELQQKGLIAVVDYRGPFKMSTVQYIDFCRIIIPMMEAVPSRIAAMHFLVERSTMAGFVRNLQAILSLKNRLRVRIHVGSWMEIQYSLRSYGIDIAADWLEGDVEGSPFSCDYIEARTHEYLKIEEEWKRNEAPYCDPSSNVALYPNSQDIIMGKNRNIAASWPGNMAYTALIHEYTAGYGIATRSEKFAMTKEILHRLKSEFRARFLNRKDNVGWEALSDEEARLKVSQSIRDEYRKVFKTPLFSKETM